MSLTHPNPGGSTLGGSSFGGSTYDDNLRQEARPAEPYTPVYARSRSRGRKPVRAWMILAPLGALVLAGAAVAMLMNDGGETNALTRADPLAAPVAPAPLAAVPSAAPALAPPLAVESSTAPVVSAPPAPAAAPVARREATVRRAEAAPAARRPAPAERTETPVEPTGPRPYSAEATPAPSAAPAARELRIETQPLT